MKKYTLILLVVCSVNLICQETVLNKYGLQVVTDMKIYTNQVESDSTKLLADLDSIPGIINDIRYATSDNFYGRPVYTRSKAFLRLPAALALDSIQKELFILNKSIKIFDAYRPYSVTVMFYDKIKDTIFVASAWTGSRHNRGCAVDLTIIDLKTGKELKMPTDYDDFTEKAAADYKEITPEEKQNRDLLQNIMQKFGFLIYPGEWWHFDYAGWKKYELADLDFTSLEIFYKEYMEEKNGRK